MKVYLISRGVCLDWIHNIAAEINKTSLIKAIIQ